MAKQTEEYAYLKENPVTKDYFKSIPCTYSTEENPHTALVPAKSTEESSRCYQCYIVDNKPANPASITVQLG